MLMMVNAMFKIGKEKLVAYFQYFLVSGKWIMDIVGGEMRCS